MSTWFLTCCLLILSNNLCRGESAELKSCLESQKNDHRWSSTICAMVKSRNIGDGHPTFNRNPYNGAAAKEVWRVAISHPGTLRPTSFFMVVSIGWFKIFTWEMVGNHQTSIYKWLFRVPGCCLFKKVLKQNNGLNTEQKTIQKRSRLGLPVQTLTNLLVVEQVS